MTKAKKVLFIAQELSPYVPESPMATIGRNLPQTMQESGCEIRTFMPKWGIINERRNQLHEVIRLSGMNIVIDDMDHPLIIKVASISAARMQVYFIDNDDFFHKRQMLADEDGSEYADNLQRAVFFARGVLETLKKLRWNPDIIYCQGWMSAIVPLYVKTAYREETAFLNSKVVFAPFEQMPTMPFERFVENVNFRSADAQELAQTGIDFTQADALSRLAVSYSDGLILNGKPAAEDIISAAQAKNIPVLEHTAETNISDAYSNFFDQVIGEETPEV